jgi:hypothetical protein
VPLRGQFNCKDNDINTELAAAIIVLTTVVKTKRVAFKGARAIAIAALRAAMISSKNGIENWNLQQKLIFRVGIGKGAKAGLTPKVGMLGMVGKVKLIQLMITPFFSDKHFF